jgi:hypothetical protein
MVMASKVVWKEHGPPLTSPLPKTYRARIVNYYGSNNTTISFYNMINAVLVFNNAGQPRLTKFYTQLVRL